MIQTATLSPMLPAQARSTTVHHGPMQGDFAGSFAQAKDDAAADGTPGTPASVGTIPASSPGTIVRQDAAVTGNTLPTPITTEIAEALVPQIVTLAPLVAEPLEPGQRSPSQVPVELVQPSIPAKATSAMPDVAAKHSSAPRPTTVAPPAGFAVSPRTGKAKADGAAPPSRDSADAPPADDPALANLTTIAQPVIDPPTQPLVEASPDVVPVAPFAPPPPPEAPRTIMAEETLASRASPIGGAKTNGTNVVGAQPIAAGEFVHTTPSAQALRPSRNAAQVAMAEQAVPASIPIVPSPVLQRSTLPVATVPTRPAKEKVDAGQISPPDVIPVATSSAIPVTTTPVADPLLQVVALAAAVPVAPQFSSVIPAFGPAGEQGSTAQSLEPAPLALPPAPDIAAIATPRWIATDATNPVALALAQPPAAQPRPGTVASASQVFGAAIQAATKAREERDPTEPAAPSFAAGAPVSSPSIKTAEAQQTPLDMRQERWPHAMIERIAILRDAADATDTRIRLVPDMLGAIDVSMRRDGDTVRVHFNAEQAATRTLLQDAQPRLVELAEARGLKLGQGALGDTNAGAGQQRAPTPSQIPNRTTTTAAMIADAADDTRIA